MLLPVLLVGVLVPPSADAAVQSWGYNDRTGDAGLAIDVERTALDVREPGRIRVRVFGREFIKDQTDVVRVFFDTRRRNTGPEFAASWYLGQNPAHAKGTTFLERTDSWDIDGRSVACPGLRRFVNFRTDVITLSVPRGCLQRPAQVRWSGFVGRITDAGPDNMWGKWDDFPAMFTFRPEWVA